MEIASLWLLLLIPEPEFLCHSSCLFNSAPSDRLFQSDNFSDLLFRSGRTTYFTFCSELQPSACLFRFVYPFARLFCTGPASTLFQQPGVTFVTRATQVAADCEFSCHSCGTDQLEEYVRDQVFIGVCNAVLQQDLLIKDHGLSTLATVINHWLGFESALRGQDGLCSAELTLLL